MDLRDAWLSGAELQGAILEQAYLQGATLNKAFLQGASLLRSWLSGASLDDAAMQGARLDGAQLQGASLKHAQLQGATLDNAELEGSDLRGTDFQGASLDHAWLQGALIDKAQFRNASMIGTYVFRTSGNADFEDSRLVGQKPTAVFPVVWLKTADIDSTVVSGWTTKATSEVVDESRRTAIAERLSHLDPHAIDQASDLEVTAYWTGLEARSIAVDVYQRRLGYYLTSLACRRDLAPHVARHLLQSASVEPSGRVGATGPYFWVLAEAMRSGRAEPTACPGTKGFVEQDWERLYSLIEHAPKPSPTVIAESICSGVAAPFVARGFTKNGLLASAGDMLPSIAANMRAARSRLDICPGVKHFTEEDWKELTSLSPMPIVNTVPATQ